MTRTQLELFRRLAVSNLRHNRARASILTKKGINKTASEIPPVSPDFCFQFDCETILSSRVVRLSYNPIKVFDFFAICPNPSAFALLVRSSDPKTRGSAFYPKFDGRFLKKKNSPNTQSTSSITNLNGMKRD